MRCRHRAAAAEYRDLRIAECNYRKLAGGFASAEAPAVARACGDLMLHVRHETGSNRLVVGFEGLLNNTGVDSIVRAVALIPAADMVVLNLGKATLRTWWCSTWGRRPRSATGSWSSWLTRWHRREGSSTFRVFACIKNVCSATSRDRRPVPTDACGGRLGGDRRAAIAVPPLRRDQVDLLGRMLVDWPQERVVLTGGAGFLGNHVVEGLRERGCKQIVCPRSREYDLVQMVLPWPSTEWIDPARPPVRRPQSDRGARARSSHRLGGGCFVRHVFSWDP